MFWFYKNLLGALLGLAGGCVASSSSLLRNHAQISDDAICAMLLNTKGGRGFIAYEIIQTVPTESMQQYQAIIFSFVLKPCSVKAA